LKRRDANARFERPEELSNAHANLACELLAANSVWEALLDVIHNAVQLPLRKAAAQACLSSDLGFARPTRLQNRRGPQ
jgi:hypothetical protein